MVVKGGDVDQLLATEYAQPYVQIVRIECAPRKQSSMLTYCYPQFYNVTQSKSASTALTALVFVLLMFGIINQVTTTSRQLWSFARDGGLPWSPWLSRVNRSRCRTCVYRSITLEVGFC
jgi:choline transport protein